jgi:hypothetical protein
MPDAYVTRAEFATTLSRVLYGNLYDVGYIWSRDWYQWHMEQLFDVWYMQYIDGDRPTYQEVRLYIWLTMMRVGDDVEKIR